MMARVLTEERPSMGLTGFIGAFFPIYRSDYSDVTFNRDGREWKMSCFFDRALIGSLARAKEF